VGEVVLIESALNGSHRRRVGRTVAV